MNSLFTELRKIPMLPLALATATGIQIALHADIDPPLLLWICIGFFVLAVGCMFVLRIPMLWIVMALLFFGAVGAYRASLMLDRGARRALTYLRETTEEVAVQGRVFLPASDSPQHNRVILNSCKIIADSVQIPMISRVRLYGDSVQLNTLRYNDRVYAIGRLSAGHELISTRGSLVGAVVRREAASVFADSLTLFVAPHEGISLRGMVDELRSYSRETFSRRLSKDGAALCSALLLGDRSDFGSEFTSNLRLTGLSHIFALSGMNTGLILLVVWVCICWLPIPHSVRLWILLGAVFLYMEIGREAPSLVRSSLAAAAIITGHLLHRRAVFLNLILAAAFLELLWKPLDIADAGFLLSYFAVLGIIGAYPWMRKVFLSLRKHPGPISKALASVAAGTGAAQIGTIPLIGYLFHRVPFTGVLGNLIVVPGFAFLLILAILLLILNPLLPWVADLITSAINAVAWGLGATVNVSAMLPLASLQFSSMSVWVLWALSASAAALLLGLAYRRAKWTIAGLLLAGNALIWTQITTPVSPACEVTFIDVENGDATLISAGDTHVLVDAGPKFGEWSAAQRILPVLAERGIEHLDALILTHPDNDHIGGAVELLLRTPIDRVYTNGDRGQTRTYLEVELAANRRQEFVLLSAGDVLKLAPDVTLTVLSPDSTRVAHESADNRKSLVMRLDAGHSSAILPADIDSSVEVELAAWGERMDVDLLKAPHHGSRSSTSETLLKMTTPSACVISSGRRNPYGHPAPEVLMRLATYRVPVYNTSTEGTMTFAAHKNDWSRIEDETLRVARRWKLIP